MIPASCHPDRVLVAKGLCRTCYNRQYYRRPGERAKVRTRVQVRRQCLGERVWTQHRGDYRIAEGARHPLMTTWRAMLARCYDSTHKSYRYYGARGVTVCDDWIAGPMGGYLAFETYILRTLGTRPRGMTLDRIDATGPYAPRNVRWADARTQRANRRTAATA